MAENRNKEQSRIKYPFVHNFLSQRLVKEEADLERWNEIIRLNRGELSIRQAKGNISSCQHRINELKTVIEEIKTQAKTSNDSLPATLLTVIDPLTES